MAQPGPPFRTGPGERNAPWRQDTNPWSLTLQEEEKHDHNTGVRIGEAGTPGPPKEEQTQEKTWSGLTANITAWNTSGLAWAVHQKEDFILLQETRLSKKHIRGAKSVATRQGLSAVFAPAVASVLKGQSRRRGNHGQAPKESQTDPPTGG